jgi:signal transduction histidine kinase
MKLLLRLALFAVGLLMITSRGFAQKDSVIMLSAIEKYLPIGNNISYLIDHSLQVQKAQLPSSPFIYPAGNFLFDIKKLKANYYVRLVLANESREAETFHFYAGKGINSTFYKFDSSKLPAFPDGKTTSYSHVLLNSLPYQEIVVDPGKTDTLYAKLDIHFYNWTLFDPVLIRPAFGSEFAFTHILRPKRSFLFIATIVLGVMLAMSMYALMRFFYSGQREYLYYGIAALMFIIYFAVAGLSTFLNDKSFFFAFSYIYNLLEIGGFIFYLLFISRFLKLKENLPDIFKMVKVMIGVQLFFLAVDVFLVFSDRLHFISVDVLEGLRIFLLCCSLYIIFILFSWKNPLSWYIAMGGSCIFLMGALSVYYSRTDFQYTSFLRLMGGPAVLFMFGILLEMFFFMLGLGHKEKLKEIEKLKSIEMLKLENERKELEKFRAVMQARDKERTRIAQEIHDDIGAGLTSIRLQSEILKSRDNGSQPEEIQKISQTASALVDKMNEIIWTMNPRNDSLANLVAYLRRLVVEFFEPFEIELKIQVTESIPEKEISGITRRNILLTVKEALHNIVKHSEASKAEIHLTADDKRFIIIIKDNGVGFDISDFKIYRSGIRNMSERLDVIGGSFSISNGQGTSVQLEIPIL